MCAYSKAERVFAQCFKSIYQQEAHKKEPGKWELGCLKCLLVYNAIVIIHNVSTDEQMTTESETISISISIHTERKITAKWTMDDLLNKLC